MSTQTALITGASSGIGYELSKLFAKDKYNLVLVARNKEKMEMLAEELRKEHEITVTIIEKDLSIANSAKEVHETLEKKSIHVDILINNAGYGGFGFFVETDLEFELKMMQLNMVSLTHLTKLLLKKMVEKKDGKIMNVASTASFQPGPLMSVYYATKAYVLSLSEALNNELKGSGVSVTALCPGPTTSGFQQVAKMEKSGLVSGNVVMMDSPTVARIGYKGLMKKKAIVIPGVLNKMLVQSLRISPRFVVRNLVRMIQKEK